MTLTAPAIGLDMIVAVALGLAAGLHAASYGAYKDSPHESFLLRRFIRELVFASGLALALAVAGISDGQSPFVIYLSAFALSRIATEFWKLFVRVEPQEDYRIPTQIHWVKGVVHNPVIRLALGFGFLASIYGIYCLAKVLPAAWPVTLRGVVVGLSIGICEAMAGAYKDGSIEGFYWHKFAKSPTFGALGGLIASGHTDHPGFLLLASIGSMRMFLELLFKMVVPGYAPGKFRSMTGPFTEWMTRRRHFLLPYAVTWALYVVLSSHTAWAAEPPPAAGARLAPVCGTTPSHKAEHRYTVKARVRPLLFWTGRRDVGGAWFETRETADGGKRLELLIGTDPDRTPMRINRWGYIAETICDDTTELVGLMTESSEETIEQARAATTPGQSGQVFKAIRARGTSGAVETEVLTVSPGRRVTYRDLDGVLADLPPAGTPKHAAVPPGIDSGFLVAVTSLIHDSAAASRAAARPPSGLRRAYVYAGRLYDVTLRSSAPREGAPGEIESEFQVRNRATGSTTDFRIAYAIEGSRAELPVRIVYQPRWWLELELQLAPAA